VKQGPLTKQNSKHTKQQGQIGRRRNNLKHQVWSNKQLNKTKKNQKKNKKKQECQTKPRIK
jgi:hypothetical protein